MKINTLLLILLLSKCLLATESFSNEDWQLVCDNTHTCKMAGYTEYTIDAQEFPISILFERRAGEKSEIDGYINIENSGEHVDFSKLKHRTIKMFIDGVSYIVDRSIAQKKLSKIQTKSLLQALVTSKKIQFTYGDIFKWTFSQKGSLSVMEKMDDYQKRVGTIGALYKKGDLNESEVLKAQKIPIIYSPSVENNHGELNVVSLSPDEKKLLQAKLDTFYGDKKDCWEDTNEARKTLKAYSISKKSLMVEQICWSAAYNNSNAFWLVSKKPPYTPKFLGDARYLMIAEDGSLRMGRTIKSRGIGDCFYIQRSVWDGQSFRLLLDATTGLCKGFTGGAWTLPSFQSKVEVTTSEFRASQPSAKAKEILHKENDKLADAKDYESILKLYRENARIYRNKIYENLKQHIIELKLDDEKTNELLMIELSLLKSQVNYYYINKILWHSQFDLFNGWLSNGLSITNNELETYFNVIVKNKYDYSFDTDSQWDYITYIAYPLSAGIIEYTGESYKLTDLGNSYIRFMRKNMYLVAELAKL